jgi:hypothetical protein
MASTSGPVLSVEALYAEREARRKADNTASSDLKRKADEELDTFRKRLEEFRMEDVNRENQIRRIKTAFERGETEVMLISFPASFCTDGGRAVNNAELPPLNPPKKGEPPPAEPDWLATLPAGARSVYEWWKEALKPGGIRFEVRVVSYPGGKIGDIGLFYSWPRKTGEAH